jgi:hypothetical protein
MLHLEGRVSVESDGSEKLKADIPAGYADSIFRQSPASAKAEERSFPVAPSTVFYWHEVALRLCLLPS